MDVSVISTALGHIRVAVDIAKLIKESGISLEKAETKLKLADLISALADAKIQMTEIQQLLLDRDTEIRNLQDQLRLKEKMVWEPPYYILIENGVKVHYCQQCYDKNRASIRLQGRGDGFWECKTCKNTYTDSSFHPEIGSFRSDYDPFV